MTQQNASAAEELSATAEELANQSERLQETISFFRISDQPGQRRSTAATSSSAKKKSDGKPEVHKQIAKAQSFAHPKPKAKAAAPKLRPKLRPTASRST